VLDGYIIAASLRKSPTSSTLTFLNEGVMGEGEKIYNTASNYFEQPFVYARMALYMVLILIPFMFFLNIKGYQDVNFIFCGLIVILAITMAMRWQVVLTVMGLGSLENLLKSTKEHPEDVSKGAIEGLNYFVKTIASVIMLVWISSVILSIFSWETAPGAFWLLLLGLAGFYIYSAIQGYPRWKLLMDVPIMGLFLYVAFIGIAAILGYTPTSPIEILTQIYRNNIGNLTGIGIITTMFLASGWLIYNGRKK
jgi:predicted secreted protein